jgi:chromatin structure-remodeling complex protein RSC7
MGGSFIVRVFLCFIVRFRANVVSPVDRTDTQPTRCQWEVVNDSGKPKVLGGTKTGNGAWALAWVDTVMELPGSDQASPGEIERDMLIASLG